MKRRILSMMLAGMLVFGLTACGTKDESKGGAASSSAPTGAATTAAVTEAATTTTPQETAEDTSLQYILDRGSFILGLDDQFPPMGFRDDSNNIVGFDIDLAKAVCDKLGVELVTQPISWDAKETELNTKNIDCIWNGFSITKERKEALTMTEAYLENNISLVVRGDSDITSLADMAGKNVAIQTGSAAEEALDDESNKAFKDSLGAINPFGDYVTALMDLETLNSDAVLMDSIVAKYMIQDLGKDFKVLDESMVADAYGIGFRKGENALADAVWKALTELKAEGKIAEISTKWFGEDITLIP